MKLAAKRVTVLKLTEVQTLNLSPEAVSSSLTRGSEGPRWRIYSFLNLTPHEKRLCSMCTLVRVFHHYLIKYYAHLGIRVFKKTRLIHTKFDQVKNRTILGHTYPNSETKDFRIYFVVVLFKQADLI